MVNNVNLNTPDGKRNYFVKHGIIGGAVPATIGLGIAAGAEFLMNKAAMKDEFKAAKQVVKDAKANKSGKEAIKEAKKSVKELYSKVAKETFNGGKRAALAVAAAVAGVTLFKGLVFPAVEQYLHGNKKSGK